MFLVTETRQVQALTHEAEKTRALVNRTNELQFNLYHSNCPMNHSQ